MQDRGCGAAAAGVVPGARPLPLVVPMALSSLPRLPRLPRVRVADRPCGCGCGSLCARVFLPGHDSRLRGWVLRVDRGLVAVSAIPAGEREAVEAVLAARPGAADVADVA